MTPLGDRRSHLRLEVVGTLWGGLKFDDLARVVNKSDSGVLIASLTARPWTRSSRSSLRLTAKFGEWMAGFGISAA